MAGETLSLTFTHHMPFDGLKCIYVAKKYYKTTHITTAL